MPYAIRHAGKQWKVVNSETGHVFGTHDTREEAVAQLQALYVNAFPGEERTLAVEVVDEDGQVIETIRPEDLEVTAKKALVPGVVRKLLAPEEVNGTPGERSIVVWMTTDHVDREKEVIVPEGIDFRRFLDTNPVVMAVHNYQQWPVGTMAPKAGGWIKLKRGKEFSGLVGKVIFDTDPASDEIYGKYKRDMARMVSVGVEPPEDLQPGEWGPPTAEELAKRPDWTNATRIIRRCVLTELSLCPIGMNPNALVISKAVPVADEVRKMIEEATADVTTTGALETDADPVQKLAARIEAMETILAALKAKGRPTTDDPDGDDDDDSRPETDTDDDAQDLTPPHLLLRAGHYVEFGKGMNAGCGKILSIHRSGRVPGVPEEVEGTEEEPAAKVKLYRADEAGKYRPTATCKGMRCKELSRVPHPLDDEPDGDPDDPKKAALERAIATLSRGRYRTLAEVEYDLRKRIGAEASQRAVEAIYVKRGGI